MKKNIYNGDLIVSENGTKSVDYTEITGAVYVRKSATLQADALTTIGRAVYVSENATLQADALTTIGGAVYVSEGATLQADALTTIGGAVYVREGATLQADALATIGSSVDVGEGATLQADALATIGDYVYVGEGATLQADALATIGGAVYVRKNATFKADALTTIGSSVYVSENATYSPKNAVQDKPKADDICAKLKRNGFETPDGKYIIADGILTEIISHKANVWRVRKIARTAIEYLITDGNGNYAHGATLAEAKEDLLYKVADRKKSDYEHLTVNDTLTHEDAIKCYRVITGACSSETRYFVENRLNGDRKEKYTIAEIIKLTAGEYGSETFKSFFTNS